MTPLISMIIAGFAMFGSPGPAVLSIAATGAAFGFKRGLRYAAGIITGTLLVALLVLSGIAGLVFILPAAKPIIIGAAALYILYLAFRIATAPPLNRVQNSVGAPRFLAGLALALANPKAYAGIGAVFGSHTLVQSHPGLDATAKIATLAMIIILTDPVWLLVGAGLARIMSDPKKSRALNIFFAIALLLAMILAIPGALSGS